MVELTDGRRSAAGPVDARVAGSASVCCVACTFAVGAEEGIVFCALSVTADKACGAVLAAHACADFGAGHLNGANALTRSTNCSLRTVGGSYATFNAAKCCAVTAIRALKVGATCRTLRRRNEATADAVAGVATRLIAVVAVLRAATCSDHRRAQGSEAQTEFQKV